MGKRTDKCRKHQSQPDLAVKDPAGNNYDRAGNQAGNNLAGISYLAGRLYPPDLAGRRGSTHGEPTGRMIHVLYIVST